MVRRSKHKYNVLKDDCESPPKGKKQQRLNSSTQQRKSSRRRVEGDDEIFRSTLEADGTKSILDMAADGNCLFRSLSDQLYWDYGNNHENVRSEVCDFLALSKEDFKFFLVLDENEDDEDAADFESYVSKMRSPGEWGGNVELVAAARLYRRNIKVFSAAAAYTIEHGSGSGPSYPDLMLSYHDNDHYNSVHDTKAKKPPLPVKIMPLKAANMSAISNDMSLHLVDDNCPSSAIEPEIAKQTEQSLTRSPSNARRKGSDSKQAGMKDGKCPCGSGKKYRKCCRKTCKQNRDAGAGKLSTIDASSNHVEIHEHEVENGFKILKI